MQSKNTCHDFQVTKLSYKHSEKIPEELEISLNEIAQNEGYKSYKIVTRTISTDGGNFLAILHEVDIIGETDGDKREMNIFVKQAVSLPNKNIVDISRIYSKELFYYGELSKLFEELQNDALVPQDDRLKCAKLYNESSTDAIILQNLIKIGYETVHRFNVLPFKFAELSIQQLARFHSLSFILKQRNPEFFQSRIKVLKPSIIFGDDYDKYCEDTYKTSVKGLIHKEKKMMEENFFKYLEHYKKLWNGSTSNIKCLCHGDYKMSNILMKISNGVIDNAIPIDFQHLHYGSPLTDFMYFIFTATDRQFRKKYLEHLKNLYFETMERFLNYFTIDISSVYPREQFEIDYDNSLIFGLYVMLFIMPVCFNIEGDEPDLHNKSVFDITLKVDKVYYERLTDVINDMIDYEQLSPLKY